MYSDFLFNINTHGWLTYEPHNLHSRLFLPVLVKQESKGNQSNIDAPIYELLWPGLLDWDPRNDAIPEEVVASWPKRPTQPPVKGRYAISILIESGLPDELPESLAYHLALNFSRYKIDRPVAGLPGRFARSVVQLGRFGLDHRYFGAAQHMRGLAESHFAHPLLEGFGTGTRERLGEIQYESTRLFFYLLGDRRLDVHRAASIAGGEEHQDDLWAKLACYLFWVGRSGSATYESLADLNLDELDLESRFHDLSVRELKECLSSWRNRCHTAAQFSRSPRHR